jgi:hypothetical protein
MKIISFDIGIKNMAYCILSKNEPNGLVFLDWNVLNLMDSEEPARTCSHLIPPKTKKSKELPKICGKAAKYQKNDVCYCEKHAKINTAHIVPTKQMSTASLKKMKVDELLKFGNSLFVFSNIENPEKLKRAELLGYLDTFFKAKCYEPIIKKQSVGAGDVDLVKIGKNMKTALNQVLETHNDITHVVIENQISPIANRMKTIQGMLAQYFIMTQEGATIDFVSSANKLKQFVPKLENTMTIIKKTPVVMPNDKSTESKPTVNANYKQHKLDGVEYCSRIIENNPSFAEWKESLNTKKKDDLADCFLQGLWYLKHRNIITYADDLKINLV